MTIDDAAIGGVRQLLSTQQDGVIELPDAFGRYEFGPRRVGALQDNGATTVPPQQCLSRQNRLEHEIYLEIAALDPGEPVLERVSTGVPLNSRPDMFDRTDGLWSVLLSRKAHEKLLDVAKLPSNARFICMEVQGAWVTAEIAGLMTADVRGRFAPYDVIMSAPQWRDFGPVSDRSYYQNAAFYFDPEPARSSSLANNVRTRAAEISGPPNSHLVQSLANEAAFERISAALEKNLLSKVIVGFLGSASLLFLILVVYGFLSENFMNNLKPICVAIAFGAGFREIALVQVTRVLLLALPAILLAGLGLTGFGAYEWCSVFNFACQEAWHPGHLLPRFWLAGFFFVCAIPILALVVSGWRTGQIKRRALTDQLKELD
jgi:hypothetical protein